jgi:hypothetical protein
MHFAIFHELSRIKEGGGTRKRSWLRNYATRRKVAGSIPDEITGFVN